ncbi:MAG: nicotinamidase [Nitrospirae bacterium]|nr:nicotinamidase [Candidatus Manganitrophaceae bacterium]
MKLGKRGALILVDVQNDFCPGGALPVPEGDRVVPVLNDYVRFFINAGAPIYATRDWHPPEHLSFKPQGGIWPPHCVQGTPGAEFHPALALPDQAAIVSKGSDPKEEAYSGFQGTGLAERLKRQGIRRLFIGGLATDYCVKNTVLDSLGAGFETVLLRDASRGVEGAPGDTEKALAEMEEAGAHAVTFPELKAD